MVQVQKPLIRVLIADKSGFARLILSEMINAEPELLLLDTAATCEELLMKMQLHKPDVLVAGAEMLPKPDSNFTCKSVFTNLKIPVLLLIEEAQFTRQLQKQAQALGVFDFIRIPAFTLYPQLRSLRQELISRIRQVQVRANEWEKQSGEAVNYLAGIIDERRQQRRQPDCFIVIGASTGGTVAIEQLVQELRPDISAAIVIAVHLPAGFTSTFAKRLNQLTALRVVEGKDGTRLEAGKIVVAPGGKHSAVVPQMGSRNYLALTTADELPATYDQPSIDLIMKSVAMLSQQAMLGVILTGLGQDGTEGAKAFKENGGLVIAQDKESSAIFGMAKSAIEKGYISKVLPLSEIAQFINRFATECCVKPNTTEAIVPKAADEV